jgi:hypothetical protein
MGRRPASSLAREPEALPPRLAGVPPMTDRRRPRGSSPVPRATHARGSVEDLLWSPKMEKPLIWEEAHCGGAASAGGSSCPVGAVPTAYLFFFCVALWRCGVGQWHIMPGRRRPHCLSEMMAAMPPRPKASFTYAFYLFAFYLDRVRVSGIFAVSELLYSPPKCFFNLRCMS